VLRRIGRFGHRGVAGAIHWEEAGSGGRRSRGGGYIIGWRNGMMPGLTSSLTALEMSPGARRVLLSAAGNTMLVRRTYGVWRTKGEDLKLANQAVEESLISVLLVLASILLKDLRDKYEISYLLEGG